jgi:hypothetical protein
MSRWKSWIRWAWILTLVFLLALPAQAQEGLKVEANEYSYEFAKSINFRLVAEAPKPISRVFLIYSLGQSGIVHKQAPQFKPGTHVEASWEWELGRGALAPGTLVKYYWRLEAEDGTIFKTEPTSFRYEDNRFKWRSLQSGPVTLYWYKGTEDWAKSLLEAAQKALERLEQDMGIEFQGPVNIYIYASRGDMREAIPSRSQTFDEATVTLGMVLSEDTVVVLGTDPDLDKTIAHELSHLVVGKAVESPLSSPLPRWLDEGLAMYAEGELPAKNALALEEALREGKLISVRSLSGYVGEPEKVDLFYAEAYSLVEFLLKEYGKEKMREFLAEFAKGSPQEEALSKIYGLTIDELDAKWRNYLKQKSTPATRPSTPPFPCPSSLGLVIAGASGAWLLQRKRKESKG